MGATTYLWVRDRLGTGRGPGGAPGPTPSPAGSSPTATCPASRARTSGSSPATSAPCGPTWPLPPATATCGSSAGETWPRQFAEAGHLDEIIACIAPVTLGAGRPIFPRRFDLRLAELAQNKAFIAARYEVVGPLAP